MFLCCSRGASIASICDHSFCLFFALHFPLRTFWYLVISPEISLPLALHSLVCITFPLSYSLFCFSEFILRVLTQKLCFLSLRYALLLFTLHLYVNLHVNLSPMSLKLLAVLQISDKAQFAQLQKSKRPNQKVGKRTKQIFLQRRHTHG